MLRFNESIATAPRNVKLRGGFLSLAIQLQEAADLSANDISRRLSDAIRDQHQGTGQWGYYIDHFGDGESGDVIYCCGGDTMKASYEMADQGGAAPKPLIDFEGAMGVMPRTVYEEEADEDGHYAAMNEAAKADKTYIELPAYERFISKGEREKAPGGSFAGKGKSFPILKPGDVAAAAHALGRAGSGNYDTGTIKRNIIRIAKEKGWESSLPKAWRDGAKESQRVAPGDLVLVESASTLEVIHLQEAKADYEIKLIAPGKGSSAFYPAEVLKRDGPKVFTAGTHVYLNHPTAAEEAARPEGDVSNLAGVLTTPAAYSESHAKGPGLYARMKVFADHAQMVEEKAPHVGMSIRASGVAEAGKMRDGVPVLKELTGAESVDVVTRAGAGGMILTEAAHTANSQQEVSDMDAAELKKLQEAQAALVESNRKLLERAIRGDAREAAARILTSVSLPEASKARVINDVLTRELPLKEGALDAEKFTIAVNEAAKAEGQYVSSLTGGGRVTGMGSAGPAPETDPAKIAAREAAVAAEEKNAVAIFESLGMSPKAAQFAAKGRAA